MCYERILTDVLTVSENLTGSSDIQPTAFTLQKHTVYKDVSVYKISTYILSFQPYPQSDRAYNDDDVLIF